MDILFDVCQFIDLHVHIGPEILPRKYTVQTLVIAEQGKIAGMALKSHFYPTIPQIKSVADTKGLILVGSITLNNYIGGLNADAIYASATLSSLPLIVWFPTINAQQFVNTSRYEIPPEWVGKNFVSRLSTEVRGITILDKRNLSSSAVKVLEAIKENNCVLATGHLAVGETMLLVEKAVEMGITRIIITHPIYQRIGMDVRMQQALAMMDGVYIEHNYAMYLVDKILIGTIAEQIKAVGAAKCIISSDMGQCNSPSPSEGLREFCRLLLAEGITEEELRLMGEINPRKLLGLL